MMAEVGIPIAFTLRYEVDPLLLTVQLGGAAAHEATTLWDVKTAVDSDREVRPVEQHIHSFLELLPYDEELLRCVRAAGRNRKRTRDEANWYATKGR